MESWRQVWRDGFAPQFSKQELEFAHDLLSRNDPRLMQGSTTTPPPLMNVQNWPCEAADLLGCVGVFRHGGWGEATVGQCEEVFARLCFDADQTLGEAAACRWFLNWFDDTPRDEMRRQLMGEITLELLRRDALYQIAVNNLPPDMRKAIDADRGDETLRGAAADWLEENDFDTQAEYLRSTMTTTLKGS